MIYVKIEQKYCQRQDNICLLKVLQKLKETKLQSRKEKSRNCNKTHGKQKNVLKINYEGEQEEIRPQRHNEKMQNAIDSKLL